MKSIAIIRIRRNRMRLLILSLLVLLTAPVSQAVAGDCCNHCGCTQNFVKVCRVVCETRKVTEHCWRCVCEDYCMPGKSEKCGCSWIPSCGKVRTRKKLIRYTITREVPVYKCVVEYRCCNCEGECGSNLSCVEKGPQKTPPAAAKTSLHRIPQQESPRTLPVPNR